MLRLRLILIISLVCASALADAPEIDLVFPEMGSGDRLEVSDNVSRLRFNGTTDPAATLTLNGEIVQVWSTGAFAGLLRDLREGSNDFTFAATFGGETTTRTIVIIRRPPPEPLPASPVQIIQDSIQPSRTLVVAPGDVIDVSFVGSQGGTASATLGRSTRVALTENPQKPGHYRGSYTVTGNEEWNDDELTVRITAPEGEPRHMELSLPSILWSLNQGQPPLLEVRSPDRRHAPLYTDPDESERLMDLPEGTRLAVSGRRDDHWRVDLAPGHSAWIPINRRESFSERVSRSLPSPRGEVRHVSLAADSHETRIAVDLSVPLAMQVTEDPGSHQINLRLFGVTSSSDQERDIPVAGIVQRLQWERESDYIHTLAVPLNNQIWGWNLEWEGSTLIWTLRHPPRPDLAGLHIVLDPGHGGQDSGAVGSTRLLEKTANLQLATALERVLSERGAEVTMLRSGDDTLGLNQRTLMSQEIDPDLFLSIHANSIGISSDPIASSGTTVYYSHAFDIPLARSIEEAISSIDGIEGRGVHQANYRVTRPMQRPSVLIETLFLSNPGDEAMLMDSAKREQIATAIADGIERWVAP